MFSAEQQCLCEHEIGCVTACGTEQGYSVMVLAHRCEGPWTRPKIGGGPAVFPPSPRLTYQPACKPGSVWPAAPQADVTAIPLARRLPGASSNLPERLARTDLAAFAANVIPIRSCSRWGLPCRCHCWKRGALLPHRFTLTAANTLRGRGGLFSVALSLRPAPKGPAPPDVIRHRSSMEPGLSSPAAFRHCRGAAVRPTDRIGVGALGSPVKPGGRTVCEKKARTCREERSGHWARQSAIARFGGGSECGLPQSSGESGPGAASAACAGGSGGTARPSA